MSVVVNESVRERLRERGGMVTETRLRSPSRSQHMSVVVSVGWNRGYGGCGCVKSQKHSARLMRPRIAAAVPVVPAFRLGAVFHHEDHEESCSLTRIICCGGRNRATMNDQDAIRELQRKWFQATSEGDVAKIAELMTDDVVFLTPGRPPFGRKAFLESFTAMKEHVTMSCNGEYLEIIVTGDFAVATASLDITVTSKVGGTTKRLVGNTLSVFTRHADGRWQLSRDANLLAPQSGWA